MEESLLGAMMLSREAVAVAEAMVTAADFYKSAHGHLFDAVVSLTSEGMHADSVTVADRLRRSGLLDGVGGTAVLAQIMVSCPSTTGALTYARGVAELAQLRRQIATGEEIVLAGYEHRLYDPALVLAPVLPRGLRLLSPGEMDLLSPPSWLIDGLLPAGGLVTMFGPPGSYKTFLALSMACSVAAGFDWFGRATVAGDVVYIAGEGGLGLAQRRRAWEMDAGVQAQRLWVLPEAIDLRDGRAMAWLLAQVRELEPRLMIVDTWARCMPGADENSAKDTSEAIASLDLFRQRTGATVVVVHHTPLADTSRERGSGALPGALDTRLGLERKGHRVTMTCRKQKDAVEPPDLVFDLLPVADSLVPTAIDAVRTLTSNLTDSQTAVVRTVRRLSGNSPAPTKAIVAQAKLPRSTVTDALRTLLTRGVIGQPSKRGGYFLTDLGEQVCPKSPEGVRASTSDPRGGVRVSGGPIGPGHPDTRTDPDPIRQDDEIDRAVEVLQRFLPGATKTE